MDEQMSSFEKAGEWWDHLENDERFWRLYHSEEPGIQIGSSILTTFRFSSLPKPAQEYVEHAYEHRQDGYGYLFGIALEFTCPKCGKDSLELAVLRSFSKEPDEVNSFLSQQEAVCVNCQEKAPAGFPIQASVYLRTYEELRTLGFAVPPIT